MLERNDENGNPERDFEENQHDASPDWRDGTVMAEIRLREEFDSLHRLLRDTSGAVPFYAPSNGPSGLRPRPARKKTIFEGSTISSESELPYVEEVGPGKIEIFVNFLVPCEVWIEGVPGLSSMQVLKVGKERLAPFRVSEALAISFQGRPIQYGRVSEDYELAPFDLPVENVRNATYKVVQLWGTNIDENDPNYMQGQLQALLTFKASNIPQSLPPTRPTIVEDFARYSDPDGCMALQPGSTASPSTDNSTLFTAEKLVVIGPTRDGEVEWFRGHILSCIDPTIGFIRHPNKREPTSYDDLIGAFAFLKRFNYINDARALRTFMGQRHWKNGNNHVGRFPQLTAFATMCANEDPGIGGLLGLKAAFLANSGIQAPVAGRIWAESKNETSGKCMLYLMTRIIEGHGHIWQAVVDDWHKFIQQTYGRREMREVYKIYFGSDHPMTKYAKAW